jgi:hypothetical protein
MSMLRPSANFLRDFSAKVIEHRKERQGLPPHSRLRRHSPALTHRNKSAARARFLAACESFARYVYQIM